MTANPTSSETHPAPSRPIRTIGVSVVLIVLLFHVAGRVGAYCSPMNDDDSYIFTSFGCRMAAGDVLYRDMSDIKPPGLFMLYAMSYWIGPAVRSTAIVIESLFLLGAYYVMYRFGRDVFGAPAGYASAIVGAACVAFFGVSSIAIVGFGVAEGFMVLPAAAAAYFYCRDPDTPSAKSLLLAGVCLGVATCIKQTALPVVVALVAHLLATSAIRKQTVKQIARNIGLVFVGGCIGWSPAIILMASQGTLSTAVQLLTSDAHHMLGRASAWPATWWDVLPLWCTFVWILWAIALTSESRIRAQPTITRPAETSHRRNTISFLALWIVFECALVSVLPLRSAHYYVSSSVPIVLLSGWPVAEFAVLLRRFSRTTRQTFWSFAIVLSATLAGLTLVEIVPRAITAYQSYDWTAERERFDQALNWGPIHFGRGEPFLDPPPTR
jgi:4-amino-4-deoxy-L-arabinose transferase-like glycosyltransferase